MSVLFKFSWNTGVLSVSDSSFADVVIGIYGLTCSASGSTTEIILKLIDDWIVASHARVSVVVGEASLTRGMAHISCLSCLCH